MAPKRWMQWSVGCVAGAALVGRAAGPSPPAATRSVDAPTTAALIAQLAADDPAARQSAEDALVARGDAVRPAVTKAGEATDPEVRSRGAVVLSRLNEAAIDRPTLVNLHLKDASPHDVFAEIAKQANVAVNVSSERAWTDRAGHPGLKIRLDLTDRPFWLAMGDACERAGATVRYADRDRSLLVSNGGTFSLNNRRSEQGQFVVTAVAASRAREISYTAGVTVPPVDSLEFELFVDPRVTLLDADESGELIDAVDDRGQSLVAPVVDHPHFPRGQPLSRILRFSVPLKYANDGYTKLSRLRGTLGVTVFTKSDTLEVADVAKSLHETCRTGAYAITVEAVVTQGDRATYTLTLTGAGRPVNDVVAAAKTLRLSDGDGHAVPSKAEGIKIVATGPGDAVLQCHLYVPQSVHGPIKLVGDVVRTRRVKVPFAFDDLPLPTF